MSKCLNKQCCLRNPIREGGRCPVLLVRLTDCGKGQGSPCRQRSKSAGDRPGGSLKQGMWSRGEQNSGRFWCNDGGE